jgi:hypothetical protein
MLMPETPVDKHHLSSARKCQIRGTRQITPVKAEAVSESVRQPTDGELGLGVFAPDSRHQGGSLFCREYVHRCAWHSSPFARKDYA